MQLERVGVASAAIINLNKYVFSTRLTDPGWPNTTVIREDLASFVRRLKEQDGQDVVLYGHGPVGHTLLENGLLDELKLWVHPVVVGQGTLWFRDTRTTGLRLLRPPLRRDEGAPLTAVRAPHDQQAGGTFRRDC